MKEFVSLKSFLKITEEVMEIELGKDKTNKATIEADNDRIKMLFDIALLDKFVMYFDGGYVDDPYDGLEFKTEEEEFYYNNGRSYLVFEDESGFKVRIRIPCLKIFEYQNVCEVVIKAIEYTKAHPEVSEYKFFY